MTPDVFAADGVKIVHRGVQADRAGDVRRAGLEPMRRVFEFRLVVADGQNHFAAALIRRHGVEQFLPSPQNANAGRSANLVAGKRKEIAADGLHVHGTMPGTLRAIHERDDAKFPRPGAKFGNGIHRAERIGDVNHRENLHLLGQHRIELGQIENAFVAGDGHIGNLRAGFLREQLPRNEIAVVLHFGEQNHITGFEVFRAPGTATRLMPSVVPRVKTISSALLALMNFAARARAAS